MRNSSPQRHIGKKPPTSFSRKTLWASYTDIPKFKNPTQQIEKLNFVVWKQRNTID
jgi:hypothetical protein